MTTSRLLIVSIVIGLRYKNAVSDGPRNFSKGFIFGASTSSYQIEGAWDQDGKGLSIWDVTTHQQPSPINNNSNADVAADSYHLYKRDVSLMKHIGLDFYRFSISWTRIFPEGFPVIVNKAGIDYYNKLIDHLLENNIKPIVTIYHWDLPHNLQKVGGWANQKIVSWFRDYSKVLFEAFGDRVKQWVTINNPKEICHDGYGSVTKAPQLNSSGIGEYMCAKNVLLAHAKAYRLYVRDYKAKQNGTVGIAVNCTWYEPLTKSKDDLQAAADARLFDWGLYIHPIFSITGDYPPRVKNNIFAKSTEQGYPKPRLTKLCAEEIEYIRGTADFLGVNSYSTKLAYRDASLQGLYPVPSFKDDVGAAFKKKDAWPQSQSSWLQEVPWGFYNVLMSIKNEYNNPPVFVTENGWSSAGGLQDNDRVRFLKNYLSALLDAVDQGADIRGYAVWSLIDSFEWIQGYSEKFGLFEIDFSSPDRFATPRKSAYLYKTIIETRMLDKYFDPEDVAVEVVTRLIFVREDDVYDTVGNNILPYIM